MGRLKRMISILLILTLMLSLFPISASAIGGHKDYTILVYMVGSDLESGGGGYASTDLREMIGSGVDFDNVNVVVYTGGANRWELNIPNNKNTVLELNEDGYTIVASTSYSMNMAESATLTDFLSFAYSNYPSDHYGLILWDHGGGPMLGFGSDEIYGGDLLTMAEMEQALNNSPFNPYNKLDFIGFDACLMASLEVADTLKDYANYLVASEESEPGCGWGYSFLSTLNKTNNTPSICQSIIDHYAAHAARAENASMYNFDVTLSYMDLSMVNNVIYALDGLMASMLRDINAGGYYYFAQLRTQTKEFTEGYDLVDLGHMSSILSPYYPTETAALDGALSDCVISSYADIENCSGLTLYYPYNNMDYYAYNWYMVADGMMAGAQNYYSYLSAFVDQYYASTARDSFTTRGLLETASPDEFTMQLTQQQVDALSGAYYTILKKQDDNDGYGPVLMNVSVQPDENNVLHIPYDLGLFCCITDEAEEPGVWKVSQVRTEPGRTIYKTENTRLYSSTEFNYYGVGPFQDVSASFYTTTDSQEAVLISVNTDSGDFTTSGKNDISLEGWGSIGYYDSNYYIPTYDTEGELLLYTQWETNGWTGSYSIHTGETFRFKKQPISQLEGEFVCQILLEDVSGNIYASDLVSFPEKQQEKTALVATPGGEMTFTLQGDHAVLTEYKGTDTALEIPDTVEGLPVTEIGEKAFFHQSETAAMSPVNDNTTLTSVIIPDSVVNIQSAAFINMSALETVKFGTGVETIASNAFSRCYGLKELILPEGLIKLGYYAFADCYGLTSLSLPASLSDIGRGAFAGLDSLTAFSGSETGAGFTIIDGVLFNADKTELLAFPGSKTDTYEIPQGVKAVAPYAFASCGDNLRAITFPDTLERIEQFAFYGCESLEGLSFPDSLSHVGNAAFYISSLFENSTELEVNIGAALSSIGGNAFSGAAASFAVSESNSHYSAVDGFLLNKQGDTLLTCPSGKYGTVTIPEGVVTIAANAFDGCDDITTMILPDSLVTIDYQAGVPYRLVSVTVGRNLINWENIRSFDSVSEFIIDPENPAYTMVDGVIYSGDMTTMLLYPISKTSRSYKIPEGVTSIRGAFYGNTFLKALHLPASLQELSSFDGRGQLSSLPALESISVADANDWLYAEDGLLYTENTLLFCPCGKTGTIQVKDGTQIIGSGAFGTNLQAEAVILPEGITWIQENNFDSVHSYAEDSLALHLPDSLELISNEAFQYEPQITFHCSAASKAKAILTERGFLDFVQ